MADIDDVQCLLDQLEACLIEMVPTHRASGPLPRDWHVVTQRLHRLLRRLERAR